MSGGARLRRRIFGLTVSIPLEVAAIIGICNSGNSSLGSRATRDHLETTQMDEIKYACTHKHTLQPDSCALSTFLATTLRSTQRQGFHMKRVVAMQNQTVSRFRWLPFYKRNQTNSNILLILLAT